MYVSPLIASAERWSGSRQRWSGMRARASQLRQKPAVAASCAVRLVDCLGRRQLLGPGQRAEDLLALFGARAGPAPDRPRSPTAMSVCSLIVSSAPQASARWPSSDDRPFGRDPPVVEDRFAGQFDLDLALQAQRGAHEHVVGVFVGRRARVRRHRIDAPARAERERVAHDHPAGRRLPRRQQRCSSRARRRAPTGTLMPNGPKPEGARLAVEQRAEHAGRVEARHAQPVDRPVGGDQRAGVAVRQERVVGDRRERRGHRRALQRWALLAHTGCSLGGDVGLGFARFGRGLAGLGRGLPRLGWGFARFGGAHDCTHGPCQVPNPATSSSAAFGPQEPGA